MEKRDDVWKLVHANILSTLYMAEKSKKGHVWDCDLRRIRAHAADLADHAMGYSSKDDEIPKTKINLIGLPRDGEEYGETHDGDVCIIQKNLIEKF